jgi:hypothetical protein
VANKMKNVIKSSARVINLLLSNFDLKLDKISRDLDVFPLNNHQRDIIIDDLSTFYKNWITSQTIYPAKVDFDYREKVDNFYSNWKKTPFNSQFGGSRFNNLLWLHLLSGTISPDIIIDSGTYQGASAWALQTGAPNARVMSFDISFNNLIYRTKGVEYYEHDWTEIPELNNARLSKLCYFDDHLNQAKRLIEAADRGCELLVFDDDFPLSAYYHMAPDASVLPKIEFLLDERIDSIEFLHWGNEKKSLSWKVDHELISRARERVAVTERLPSSSLITGIHQTPYRIVRTK